MIKRSSGFPSSLLAVCLNVEKHVSKKEVLSAFLKKDWGILGDAHAGSRRRQVSLLLKESVDKIRLKKITVRPGIFGENFLIDGLSLSDMRPRTRLRLGKRVIIEITHRGKKCHKPCSIYDRAGFCIMPQEGIFANVLQSGWVKKGDRLTILSESKGKFFHKKV